MKSTQNFFLQNVIKVNHKIAATDYVYSGKRRVFKNIVRGKYTQIADGLCNSVTTIYFGKKILKPFRRNIGNLINRIYTKPCFRNCKFTKIRCKNLYGSCGYS